MSHSTLFSKSNRRRKNLLTSSSLLTLLLALSSVAATGVSSNSSPSSSSQLSNRFNDDLTSSKIINQALFKSKVLTRRRKDEEEEEGDESKYYSSKDSKGKSSSKYDDEDEYQDEEDEYEFSSKKGSSYKEGGDDFEDEEDQGNDDDEEEGSKSSNKGSSTSGSNKSNSNSGSNTKTWHRMTRSGFSSSTKSSSSSKSTSSKATSSTPTPASLQPTPIATATVPVLKTWSSDTSTWVVTDGWTTSTEFSSPTPVISGDVGIGGGVGLPQAQATQAWVTKKAKVQALAIASASSKAVAAAAISTGTPMSGGMLSQQVNVDYSWMTPSPGQVYSGGQDVVLAWQAAQAPDLNSLHLRLCLLNTADDMMNGAYNSGASCGEAASTEVQANGNNAFQITFPAPNVIAADSFYVVMQVKAPSSSDDSESSSDDKDSKDSKSSKDWSRRGNQAHFSVRDGSSSQMLSPAFVLAPYGSDTSPATIQAAVQQGPDSSSSSDSGSGSGQEKGRPANALAIALPLSIAGTVALAALGMLCYRRGQRGNTSEQEANRRALEVSRVEDRKEREELTRQLTMAMAVKSSSSGSSTLSSRLGSSISTSTSSLASLRRGSNKELPRPPPQAVSLRDEEERYTSFAPVSRREDLERSRSRSHRSSRPHSRHSQAQSPRSSAYHSTRDTLRRCESKSSSSYYHSRCDCSSCDSGSSVSSGSSSPISHGSYERFRKGYGQRNFHDRHHRMDPFEDYYSMEKDKEAMRYTDARLAAMQLPHLSMNMPSIPPMMERSHSRSPPHYETAFIRREMYPTQQIVPQMVSPPPQQQTVQMPMPTFVQQQPVPPPPPMVIFTSPTESQKSSAYYDAASMTQASLPAPQPQIKTVDGFGGFSYQSQRIVSSPPLVAPAPVSMSSVPDILRPSSPVGISSVQTSSKAQSSLPNPFELLGFKSKVVEEVASPSSTYSQGSSPPSPAAAAQLGLPSSVQRNGTRSVSSSFAERSGNTGVTGSASGKASEASVKQAGEAQAIYEKLREVLKGSA